MHVIISLVGIATGFVVMKGMLASQRLDGWTAAVPGYHRADQPDRLRLSVRQALPSHIFGVISLVVLLIAIARPLCFGLEGRWRWAYVVTALVALWLNVFVLVVQSFNKVTALQALAPTQSEPPFLIAQTVVMVLFIIFGIAALRHFRPAPE